MYVLIISDDQYFSLGAMAHLMASGIESQLQSWREFSRGGSAVSVSPDILVADMGPWCELWRAGALLNRRCPVLLVVDMAMSLLHRKRPFLSKKEGWLVMLRAILLREEPDYPHCSGRGARSLQCFNAGTSISQIAKLLERSEVSIYRLKSDVVVQSGFLRYHPQAGRYCEWLSALAQQNRPGDLPGDRN